MYTHACIHEWLSSCLFVRMTFVSDEVSAKDDEEAEENEDDHCHDTSDDGMVHSRADCHSCGVCARKVGTQDGTQRR